MLNVSEIDLEELVIALRNQDAYHHFWLIDPATGEITFASQELDPDFDPDFDRDESDLVHIEALPSCEWAGHRLARAIRGRGAFRRFKNELHEEYPHLLPRWYEFSSRRGIRRAVRWLADHDLVDADKADRFLADHPDLDLSESPGTGQRQQTIMRHAPAPNWTR